MSENGAGDGVREAIVVVDDESFSRECLIEALRGFFPHASISGVVSLDDLYRSDGITVALVVLKAALFPTCDSIARAIRQLNRSNPEAAAVLVSAKDDIDVIQAIGAGVKGVVPVTASLKVGVAAFRLVIAGGTYYPRPGPNYLAPANGTPGNGHAAATASPHVLPPRADSVGQNTVAAQGEFGSTAFSTACHQWLSRHIHNARSGRACAAPERAFQQVDRRSPQTLREHDQGPHSAHHAEA